MRDLFVARNKQAKIPKTEVVVLLKKGAKTKSKEIFKMSFMKNFVGKIKSVLDKST
jgi:hypothetical protein